VKVEIRLVPELEEPVVVIEAAERTEAVAQLAEKLEQLLPEPVTGWQAERAVRLNPAEVLRFYSRDKGVFAQTGQGEFAVRLRLYELEERLEKHTFVRISQSEIVNLKQVTALDLALTGTIKMTLTGGVVCYVSRRYVKKIKEALGLGRRA